MILRTLIVLLLCATVAMAESAAPPATQPDRPRRAQRAVKPATQPATKPAAIQPATQPATRPAATLARVKQPSTQPIKFPSPQELLAQWKKQKEEKAALSQVAYFDLSEPIGERPGDFSFFAAEQILTLRSIVDRLHAARDDEQVRAVLITLGAGASFNLTQAQELRDAISEIRRGGKKVFVYADSYDTLTYLLASAATNVCLLDAGQIMIPGVGFEAMFFRGTLDKVGIHPDFVQIGEYKGAEEPYTRTQASPELKSELEKLADALYAEIIDAISLSRNLSSDKVRQLIDDTMVNGAAAKQRGFVDHLCDQDGLRGLIKDELGDDIDLIHDYAAEDREQIDLSNPFGILAAMAKKPEPSELPEIALIYAQGVIVDGEAETGGLFSEAMVGSETMRRAFRAAMRDGNVKAVVIRIDSPGGSALASEVMWQSVRRLAKEKPVIISIGSMAASGGYYLASAGDTIYADPAGIVGSIGVVGGKMVMRDLFEKLGLSTETITRGRNADLYSSTERWNDRQRRLVRTMMQETYDQFTQRVMETRNGKIKDIDKVARGRIFTAKQARDLGMVDEIGGLSAALARAAGEVDLEEGAYDVRVMPAPKTLADLINGSTEDAALPFKPQISIQMAGVLHLFPREIRGMLERQWLMSQILDSRPVMLMSPYTLRVR